MRQQKVRFVGISRKIIPSSATLRYANIVLILKLLIVNMFENLLRKTVHYILMIPLSSINLQSKSPVEKKTLTYKAWLWWCSVWCAIT
jgi:type III secretory pathway component EscT